MTDVPDAHRRDPRQRRPDPARSGPPTRAGAGGPAPRRPATGPHPVPAGGPAAPSPTQSPRKSDLKVRVLTGIPLAAVVIGLAVVGSGALLGVVMVVVLIAQGEFYLALTKSGYRPATALGLVAGGALLLGTYRRGMLAAPLVLFLTVALSVVWHAWGRDRGEALADLAVTLVGVAYIPLLASFAAAALARPDGRAIVLATIGAAAGYDIFAYAGGRTWGRHKLAPAISPGKTREGALVATGAVVVLVGLVAPLVGPWNIGEAALLGLLVCVAAPMGDLFESVLKRDLGIKDMGSILPGHGGILDRIDAILFCVPVSFLTLRLFGI